MWAVTLYTADEYLSSELGAVSVVYFLPLFRSKRAQGFKAKTKKL